MSAIQANGLGYSYPGRDQDALDDVSFRISAGSMTFLLGPNGSGKSTLFRILLRLLRADRGRVTVAGRPLDSYTTRELAGIIGYIPQLHEGSFNFTARHAVVLGKVARRGMRARPTAEDWLAADEALERIGIADLGDRGIQHLSGGERQLVLLARALCQGGSILILDEPTSALDAGNQVRVLSTLRDIADSGMTVLLSTHQPIDALTWGDEVLILEQGRSRGVFAADEVDAQTLSSVYGVDFRMLYAPAAPRLRIPIAALSARRHGALPDGYERPPQGPLEYPGLTCVSRQTW